MLNAITTEKLWAAFLILGLSALATALPLLLFRRKKLPAFLMDADYFARGVFLGAGLLHLLPEAMQHWLQASSEQGVFPWVYFICALTLALLIFSEHLLEIQFNKENRDYFYLLLLVLMLTIHAFFEGLALGVSVALSSFTILLGAILAHKGIASLALSVKFQSYRLQYQRLPFYLLVIFVLSTPLGILLGSSLNQHFEGAATEHAYMNAVFESIASGTFLYLAIFNDLKLSEVATHRFFSATKILAYLFGLSCMAYLAYY